MSATKSAEQWVFTKGTDACSVALAPKLNVIKQAALQGAGIALLLD